MISDMLDRPQSEITATIYACAYLCYDHCSHGMCVPMIICVLLIWGFSVSILFSVTVSKDHL